MKKHKEYLPKSMEKTAVNYADDACELLYKTIIHKCNQNFRKDYKQIVLYTYIEGLKTYASQIDKSLDQMTAAELEKAKTCAFARARWAVLDSIRHNANSSTYSMSTRMIRRVNMIRKFLEENPDKSEFTDEELRDLCRDAEFKNIQDLRSAILDVQIRDNKDYIVHLNDLVSKEEQGKKEWEEVAETISAPLTDSQYETERANSCYEALKFAFKKCLTAEEVQILCHSKGLFGFEKMKCRELSKKYGYKINELTIRKIESKLHKFFKSKEIVCMADIL